MPPIVTTTSGTNFRVQVDAAGHTDQEAVGALIAKAQASKPYQKAQGSYELRLIESGNNKFLELHKRNALSRLSSFLKGVLTGSRSQNTQLREQVRAGAAEFYAQSVATNPHLQALHAHVRSPSGLDPVALAGTDQDKAAVKNDVDKVLVKIRDHLLNNPEDRKKLEGGTLRDGKIYAPFQTLVMKRDALSVLENWNSNWSAENTSALLMDLALLVTRDVDSKDWKRADVLQGDFGKQVNESRKAAPQGKVHDTNWAKEFVPVNSPVHKGISFSTAKLLAMLSQNAEIQPHETEAVVNGLTGFWKGSTIKKSRGEYHTPAEAWSFYNQFVESERIPRGLSALAPQSKPLIQFLRQTPEGSQKLLEAYNTFNRSVALEGKDASQLKLQDQLNALEDGLEVKQALKLRLPEYLALVHAAPDTAEFNDLLQEMRLVTQQNRQSDRAQMLDQAKPIRQKLLDALPSRARFNAIFPDSKDRANLFPAGDKHDTALGEIATRFHQRVSEGHGEDATKLLDEELVPLTAELPDRAAIQCLVGKKLYEVIESTPTDPVHDDQIREIRALLIANIKQPSSEAAAALTVAINMLGKNEGWYLEALREAAHIKAAIIGRLPKGFSQDPNFSKAFTDFLVQFVQVSETRGEKPIAFTNALVQLGKAIIAVSKERAPGPNPVAPAQESNP
jgi:hypothetical protein